MIHRRILAALACAVAVIPPAGALAAGGAGTPEQITWVRRAASNFVAAELSGNGAAACAILNAPLRATQHHRTCAQRWNVKLSKLLANPTAEHTCTRCSAQSRPPPSSSTATSPQSTCPLR